MTELEFIEQLNSILFQHSKAASQTIRNLIAALPDKATCLNLEVFTSQDQDGFFTVRASVDGPDLYVLDKAIAQHALIFEARSTEFGAEPPIPIVWANVGFPVNDTVVDCAAKWLQAVWESLGPMECRVPIVVLGHDDYGSLTPFELPRGVVS
ncbi:MAG: DUF6389 family protein [Planctomycetales bacterium]